MTYISILPYIGIHGFPVETYDDVSWAEKVSANSRWKTDDRTTVYPARYGDQPLQYKVRIHARDMATYDAFEGKEDGVEDEGNITMWKDANLGNVEVTMYRP